MKMVVIDERVKMGDMLNRTGQPVRETGLYHCRQCELVNLYLRECTEFPKCGRCLAATQWVLCL